MFFTRSDWQLNLKTVLAIHLSARESHKQHGSLASHRGNKRGFSLVYTIKTTHGYTFQLRCVSFAWAFIFALLVYSVLFIHLGIKTLLNTHQVVLGSYEFYYLQFPKFVYDAQKSSTFVNLLPLSLIHI